METRMKETGSGAAVTEVMVPDVIERFYQWAERSSSWEIAMVEWAEKLRAELGSRDIALDRVPPPPPRWP